MAGGDYNSQGDVGEAEAIAELRRREYTVSVPFGDSAPYDIVVEDKHGAMHCVQVKTSSQIDDGKVKWFIQRTIEDTDGAREAPYGERVDCFVLYSVETDQIFAIEASAAPETSLTVDVSDEENSYCFNSSDVSLDRVFP